MQNDPKDPKFLKVCFVCTENAKEGKVHLRNYGGIVCFSCRAFWQRSHQKTRTPMFICKSGNKCVITTSNRRTCQQCRYKKCLAAGMRPEAVLDDKQKRYHFRKLLQRQQKQFAKMNLFSGQSNTDLKINYPKVVRRPVILKTRDSMSRAQPPITYKPVENSLVIISNDLFAVNDLMSIPTEDLLFSSIEQNQVIQEEAVPSWTYL